MEENKTETVEVKPIRLDIGCGPNPKEGFIGCDLIKFDKVEKVFHAGKDVWPFDNDSVDEIHASHFLEHLTNLGGAWERTHFFNEAFRVMKKDAKMILIFPHWASNRYYGDPTHCFSEDTDILTKEGWKSFFDVKIGDLVPSIKLEDGSTEFVAIKDVINNEYNGDMLHFKTKRMDVLVTPNHDMIWRAKPGNFVKADGKVSVPKLQKSSADSFVEMGGHHPRQGTALVKWVGKSPEKITISEEGLTESYDAYDFCEFIGWFISEGHVYIKRTFPSQYHVYISQCKKANPEKWREIYDLLTKMNFKFCYSGHQFKLSSKVLAVYLKKLGLCNDKYIPYELKQLNPSMLRRLISSAVKGDGRINNKGREYATTSKKLADDMQEIALKAGYRATLYVEKREGHEYKIGENIGIARYDMNIVGISEPKSIWYPIPETVKYEGRIVCVTLESNNNIMVRRNGRPIWSGNCEPFSEMGFYYLDVSWRKAQAPHADSEFFDKGYSCDFACTWGYNLRQDLNLRNQEFQQFACANYKEVINDIIATCIKK